MPISVVTRHARSREMAWRTPNMQYWHNDGYLTRVSLQCRLIGLRVPSRLIGRPRQAHWRHRDAASATRIGRADANRRGAE